MQIAKAIMPCNIPVGFRVMALKINYFGGLNWWQHNRIWWDFDVSEDLPWIPEYRLDGINYSGHLAAARNKFKMFLSWIMAFDCCNLKVIHWVFAYVSDNLSILLLPILPQTQHRCFYFWESWNFWNKHFCHKNAIFIAALKVLCKVSISAMNVNVFGLRVIISLHLNVIFLQ